MRYREIPGLYKPVTRVVQGATMIGSDLDEAKSFALLDQIYELGCNTIDTAHVYSNGSVLRIGVSAVQIRPNKTKSRPFLFQDRDAP